MNYVKLLGDTFSADAEKVKRLKIGLIKSLIEKLPYHANYFVGEFKGEGNLYEIALQELERRKRNN